MLISLLVGLLLIALVYWVLTQIPLPPLVAKIATIFLVIFAVLWLINILAPGTLNSLGLR